MWNLNKVKMLNDIVELDSDALIDERFEELLDLNLITVNSHEIIIFHD